jgi:hypothetical protein
LELQDWLLSEGIKDDLNLITQLTVITEIDNLEVPVSQAETAPDWERLLLAGSILARSDKRPHQEAALRIATAALTLETGSRERDSGAVLLSKLANHRAIELAESRHRLEPGLDQRLGISMRVESLRRQMENSVLLPSTGAWLPVNDFQRKFWSGALSEARWLSASAPTASGKTFLVLQWLLEEVRGNDAQVAVYLAPTRALVAEIEATLTFMLRQAGQEDVRVFSLPLRDKYREATSHSTKLVYVFTQERLHLMSNLLNEEIKVDLLVVDEAHKIGDDQRGVILQDALERSSRANPLMRVVFISPATQNPDELLQDAPAGAERLAIDSDAPTVLQNVIVATQVPRKPEYWDLKLRRSTEWDPIGVLKLPSRPNGLRKRLAFIAAAAGARGGTLIYTNGAAEAEAVADLISQLLPTPEEIDPDLAGLADLARRGVHRKYQLGPLVERGVAFHYGNMPSLIRSEVERLFRIGKIHFLACTSTLVEGVNLSCRTIVLRGPRKGRGNPMEPHDFWNLAGRAGRWGDEFQGNIICIDPQDEGAWPGGVPERARYRIRRETDSVLDKGEEMLRFLSARANADPRELLAHSQQEQVCAYLLATFLREGTITQAGLAKRHSPHLIARIEEEVKRLAVVIEVPAEIATRHPGVSALSLQHMLDFFRDFEGDDEDLLPSPAESVDAYEAVVAIMLRINQSIYPAFQPEGLVPLHTLIVIEWMRGLSLAAIIRKRVEYHERRNHTYKLDKLIRETMDLVEQTARFKAPKYFSAYIDVLRLYLREVGKENLLDANFDIGLALEFGVSSVTLLSLMELGLSRMSAVSLYEKIARDDLDREGCLRWVAEHSERFEAMEIPIVIVREVLEKLAPPASDLSDELTST